MKCLSLLPLISASDVKIFLLIDVWYINGGQLLRLCTVERQHELERMWKEAVVAQFKYYPDICLKGPRKTKQN
jgi:hypothetical protein